MASRFHDRAEAGRYLAERLAEYAGRPDVVILSLPHGGVPVAYSLAHALSLPLDMIDIRTISIPAHGGATIGVVGSGGDVLLDDEKAAHDQVPAWAITEAVIRAQKELARLELVYRKQRPLPQVTERVILLVDDGLTDRESLQWTIRLLLSRRPAQLVLAIPGTEPVICDQRCGGGECVPHPVENPKGLYAVGRLYEDFYWVLGLLFGPWPTPKGSPGRSQPLESAKG